MTAPQPDAGEVAAIVGNLTKTMKEAIGHFYEADFGWVMRIGKVRFNTLLALENRGIIDFLFRPTDFGLAVRKRLQEIE